MFLHHQKVLWIKNFWAVFFSTKGALRRHPDPTYPFLALNQLNRPQKLASGHGQSPINYELRWNCHCNIFAAFDKYLLWNILIFVLYIRIWHGDLNLRYQSKGNHGGEVNVCQEFQLALAGAPDSSYKSSKKKHTPLLATLISALIYCFTVFLPCPENAPPRESLPLAPKLMWIMAYFTNNLFLFINSWISAVLGGLWVGISVLPRRKAQRIQRGSKKGT